MDDRAKKFEDIATLLRTQRIDVRRFTSRRGVSSLRCERGGFVAFVRDSDAWITVRVGERMGYRWRDTSSPEIARLTVLMMNDAAVYKCA